MALSLKDNGSVVTLRRPTHVLPALSQMGGAMWRLVGSTDARGRGTPFPIADVGPFVLVGEARGLVGADAPPFGDHPHAGLVAVSHIPGGGPWESRSNVPGLQTMPLSAGDVLLTVAGRGIVHDEPTVGEGTHDMLQIILRLPAARRDMPATLRRLRPVRLASGVACLFDRERLAGTGLDAAAFWVEVPAGASVALPLAAAHTTGFVYARSASVSIGGQLLHERDVAVLGSEGSVLRLTAAADRNSECLVALAASVAGPWAKLLGHNGFVVAADPRAAAQQLRRFERQGPGFGQLP